MFKNKVVIVTGASSGIGAATAELFAKEGASVAVVGRRADRINEVKSKCEKYGSKTVAIKADVSKDDEVQNIIKRTIEEFGKLDVLVNNAGVLKSAEVGDDNVVEVFDESIRTNLRSIVLLSHLAIPHLKLTKGNIVNVSSVSGMSVPTVMPGLTMYAVSKAGLDHYTRGAALELSTEGIRVNSVNPGPVATEMVADISPPENTQKLSPLGRFSDAEEIGEMILYLASDKARGMTGSNVVVDNGVLLKK